MPSAPATTVDERTYARLVEPHRRELHAHCYRMLRSADDAEDALQEALLRAWRGLPAFEERSSLRAWLYRISTNACLDTIERRKRVLPLDGGSPFDPDGATGDARVEQIGDRHSVEAGLEERESLEQALTFAFEQLTAQTRTVLVLRAALGYSAREVAEKLLISVAAVNSALQRARQGLEALDRTTTDEPAFRTLGDERLRDTVQRCIDAMERGDIGTVVASLAGH